MNKRHILKNIIIASVMGFVMSWLINYFVIPVPATQMKHAIGNGISGFISGLMGMMMYFIANIKHRQNLCEQSKCRDE